MRKSRFTDEQKIAMIRAAERYSGGRSLDADALLLTIERSHRMFLSAIERNAS